MTMEPSCVFHYVLPQGSLFCNSEFVCFYDVLMNWMNYLLDSPKECSIFPVAISVTVKLLGSVWTSQIRDGNGVD
jgi:hypothetical protein